MPSHRGVPGFSSTDDSHRTSFVSRKYDEEKRFLTEKENQNDNINMRNISKIHQQNQMQKSEKAQQPWDESDKTKDTNKSKTVDFVPETDQSRKKGPRRSRYRDATPQELYAIGAVFDHLYRGGSPRKCISVYEKEVNRAPHARRLGCGGSMWETEEYDDGSTTDWTYNRSDVDTVGLDLYTLDENVSREDSLFSDLDGDRSRAIRFANARSRDKSDRPWDESTEIDSTGGKIGPASNDRGENPKAKNFGKPSFDVSIASSFVSDFTGITIKNSRGKSKRQGEEIKSSKKPFDEGKQSQDDVLSKGDDTLSHHKAWNEYLASSAEDNDDNESNFSGPKMGCTATDLSSLVRLFRKTVAESLPQDSKSLQEALIRIFKSNSRGRKDNEGFSSTDGSFDTSTDHSLKSMNHLAKAMQSIASKEPTRTFAVSEQDQRTGNEVPKILKSPRYGTIGSSDILPPDQNTATAASTSPPRKQNENVSCVSTVNVSALSNAEKVGSHRGDTVPASTKSKQKVPTSIQSILQELSSSPERVSSSSASNSHGQSFSQQAESPLAGDKAQITLKNTAIGVKKTSASPRKNLPPTPPPRNPTTTLSEPSPSRTLHLSSDEDGTELSIIGSPEEYGIDSTSVVTPPRSTGQNTSVSPKSSSGINMKKRFSFRKRKPDVSQKDTKSASNNANSPRSAMRVDNHIFQSASHNRGDYCDDTAIACIADESIVAMQLSFDGDDAMTTNGLLLTQTNEESYEIQSV